MFGNAAFLLMSDVANRAATFVIYILIARHLGAEEVGVMAVALALFYVFQVFAAAGVKTIITREVARDPAALHRCLSGGALLVTLASAVSIVALAGFVAAMGYSRETAEVVLLLGLALLPYALSVVCEASFQAFERMRYIACAQIPVAAARVGLAWLLLHQGYGVRQVALLMLACQFALALVEWRLLSRYVIRSQDAPPAPVNAGAAASARSMARAAGTFLGIDGVIAIGASLNIVLLSALAGEREVGLYGAASQLIIPVNLVYQSLVVSAFPALCRRFAAGAEGVSRVLSRLLVLLLALAIPVAVGLFFLADSALQLVYGPDFPHAAAPLRVLVWTIIPSALTSVLGQVFLAGSRETVTLRIVTLNLLVGLAMGTVLITQFGLIGAAAASLLTSAVNLWQHRRLVSRHFPSSVSLSAAGWKPLVAGACMAAYLAVAHQSFAVSMILAGTLYCGAMAALMIFSAGGPRRLVTAMYQARLEL